MIGLNPVNCECRTGALLHHIIEVTNCRDLNWFNIETMVNFSRQRDWLVKFANLIGLDGALL